MAQLGRPPHKPKVWVYASVWATAMGTFDHSVNEMARAGWEPIAHSVDASRGNFYCLMRKERAGDKDQ